MAEHDKPKIDRRSKGGRKPGGNRTCKTSPDAIATAELRGQVLSLRKQGWSYSAIGQVLNFSSQRAYTVLSEALNEIITEPAQEMFELEIQRLDGLLVAVYEAAEQGDKAAIDGALRIMERRAKLLGLDKLPVVTTGQPLVIQIIAVPARPSPGHAALQEQVEVHDLRR